MAAVQNTDIMFSSKFLYPDDITDAMDTTDKNNFGILQLTTEQQPPHFKWINWVLNIDRSASMSDICPDRKTKMDHIHHTIKNMIDYFIKLKNENENLTQYLTIISFDHEATLLCNNLLVNTELQETIATYFDSLTPRGSTNIDYALRVASENILSTITEFNATGSETNLHQISHLFMSDGHITQGETNADIIQNKFLNSLNTPQFKNYTITNTFIGFGAQHDATLMKTLSSVPKGEYYFIESLENAGMVYGEILYKSLYEYLQNLTLTLHQGEIYNFKTNTWNETHHIDAISSGQTRTWHIRKKNKVEKESDADIINLPLTITGTCDIASKKSITIPTIVPSYPTEKDPDVEKYLWRQQTQEIMHEVDDYINNPPPPLIASAGTLYPGANHIVLPKPQLYHTQHNVTPPNSPTTSVKFSKDLHNLLTEEHEILDAAKSGNWTMVWSYLTIYPSLVNSFPSPRKFNLIHHAIHQENVKALEKLVNMGADPKLNTADGVSPAQLISASTSTIIKTALENILQFAELKHYGGEEIAATPSTPAKVQKSKKELETILNNFMLALKEYMAANDLTEDGFMKNLCDDIYVCTKSLTANKNLGTMYLTTRGISQGNERAYNAADFTELDRGSQPISANFRGLSAHVASNTQHTAYASRAATKMMRAVSSRE